MRRLTRTLALVALVLVSTATSCITSTLITVAPQSADLATGVSDSVQRTAFAVTTQLAARHELDADSSRWRREAGWSRCFATPAGTSDEAFFRGYLCEPVNGRRIEFWLSQSGRGFTARSDSLRRELLESLRARFGDAAVRECASPNGHGGADSDCSSTRGSGTGDD